MVVIQCAVKKRLVTEMLITNYQLLFFKLAQLVALSQQYLEKPRITYLVAVISVMEPRMTTNIVLMDETKSGCAVQRDLK